MKKGIGMLLAVCMVFSLLPFAAWANSAEPATIREGDVISSDDGWFHVRPAADGNYRFPEENAVRFVVRPTTDVSALSDAEIDYLHAKLVAEVYETLIKNAEESIRNAERDIQEAKDSLQVKRASLEADRKIIENFEQIENLVQELLRRQRDNKPPIGFLSVESWYRISMRPRLILLGYNAPEDLNALSKDWLDTRERLSNFSDEEKNVERIPAQIEEAEKLTADAKAQLEEVREVWKGYDTAAKKAKAGLPGAAPSTDDFLLTDWSTSCVYMQENEIYWVFVGDIAEPVKTVVHVWNFHLDDELNQSGLLGDLRVVNGTYVLVMHSDGTQETYYNGMLIRPPEAEEGMLTIPETVQDVTVSEVGANLIESGESITAVTIPASVTRIQTGAFQNCTALKDVYYEGTQAQWNEIHISSNNEPLTAAVLHVQRADDDPEPQPTVKPTTEPSPEPTDDPAENPAFLDVPKGTYYADAVAWAVDREITNGTGNQRFSPNEDCTRAQVVTFLWRAAGCPEMKYRNPFKDVSEDRYYYKAVLWAAANGITLGTGRNTFSPEEPCTRAQVVTFLWRDLDGKITVGETAFSDVHPGTFYYVPVLWAVSHHVTKGTDDTHFSPMDTCTRAQIVTFLFRALQK